MVQIEHGSFTPVVFSLFGGCGKGTSCIVSKLVENISSKYNMEKSLVAKYIRSKVSLELVRSKVACVRSSRFLRKISSEMEVGK